MSTARTLALFAALFAVLFTDGACLAAQPRVAPAARPTLDAPAARIAVDSARRRVVVSVGPLSIPAATPYDHHIAGAPISFAWPVSGWVRGYRIDLVDSSGRLLPREMLHHAGVANKSRRALLAPMAERLLAASRETEPFQLPESMGVPLDRNSQLLLYYALVNPTATDIVGATLRVEVTWTPDRASGPRVALPIVFDASPIVGAASVFDVPPGVTVKSTEFTLPVGGYVRELGGHLHDYGVQLRLEDVEAGEVLARLSAARTDDGRVTGVSRTHFLFKRNGLRLQANHVYRIVGVYNNPTCATITGAMAGMVGLFTPDDMRRWPAIDPTNAAFQKDYAWLFEQGDHAEGHAHAMAMSDDMDHMQMTAPATTSVACRR